VRRLLGLALLLPALAGAQEGEDVTLESLHREVTGLRSDLRDLNETLNLLVNQMMRDLEAENAQLRGEIQRLYDRGLPDVVPETAFVPRPGAEVIEEVLNEPEPPVMPIEFGHEILKEWGRDPDVAAQLGDNVSSLKGQVIVVPEGSLREDIEDLGRELRTKYSQYDNINIEVYDSREAAQSYVDDQVADPSRRVLSISKHGATGRDKILYLENGKAYEVAPLPQLVEGER